MTDTIMDTGNLYITDGSIVTTTNPNDTIRTTGSQKFVKIESTKIDYNYDNAIVQIPIPVSNGNRDATTAFARNIDLKRIKEAISVQGFLADESGSSAFSKRNNLISMGKTGGELTVIWGKDYATNTYQTLWKAGTAPYGAFILKMMFTETTGLVGTAVGGASNEEPSEKNIAIQITLVRGKDM